jgi:hypothetical protein
MRGYYYGPYYGIGAETVPPPAPGPKIESVPPPDPMPRIERVPTAPTLQREDLEASQAAQRSDAPFVGVLMFAPLERRDDPTFRRGSEVVTFANADALKAWFDNTSGRPGLHLAVYGFDKKRSANLPVLTKVFDIPKPSRRGMGVLVGVGAALAAAALLGIARSSGSGSR